MNEYIKAANRYFIEGLPINQRGVLLLSATDTEKGEGSYSNVPVSCLHHSPTGFSWGYEGSGPADLALNIVDYAIKELGMATQLPVKCYIGQCSGEAWLLHQDFKRDFIGKVPDIGGIITWKEIRMWITSGLQPQSDFAFTPELRITIIYPKNLMTTLSYIYGNMNVELSTASFFAMIEEFVITAERGYEFEHVPIDISVNPANIIVCDSAASLEETPLSAKVQDYITELLESPATWGIKA